MGEKIQRLIQTIPGASIEQTRWVKGEGAYRLWCRFDDSEEAVKVELLNFTCARLKDTGFISHPFKTENLYNLLLYKLKALCDRPDTIKDLFDLYFIFRDLPEIATEDLMADLNAKFEGAIGLRYEREHMIRALEHNLQWNIETADIEYLHDLKEEIDTFQVLLHDALENENMLDFSYAKRIKENAKKHDLDESAYLELIDVLEGNAFWVDEILRRGIGAL